MSIRLKTSRFFICCGLLCLLMAMINQGNSPRRGIAADPAAVITLVEGSGAKARMSSSAQWKSAAEDMKLPAGAEVRADSGSRVEIQLEDNSIIRLDELTSIRIDTHTAKTKKFKVDQGKLWLSINKVSSGSSFEVETPAVIAGVRGTTFRVDAGGEETGDEISVEDGEVEVSSREGKRIRVGRMMKTRFIKGRMEDPARFDPEKVKRWEKWTEKHVAARFENMRNEAAAFREKARAIATEGKAVAADALRLLKETRSVAESIKKSMQRAAKLREQTDRLLDASSSRPGRPDRGKGGRPGGQPGGGNAKLKEKAEALLQETAETEREISSAESSFAKIREDIASIKARAKSVKEDAAKLREARENFSSAFEKNRRRRKLDPQWAQLQDVSTKIAEHEKDMADNAAQIEETLSGRMLESKDKTRNLLERIDEFSQQFDDNSGKIGAATKELASIRDDLNSIINK